MKDKELKNEIISISIVGIIASTLFIICDMFFKIVTLKTYVLLKYTLKFTILLGIVVYTLFFALTKKSGRATLFSIILIFILSIINELKIMYASEPLYFSDIKFLPKIGDVLKLVTNNINFSLLIQLIMISAVYLAILGIIVFFSYKYNIEIKNKKIRFSIIVIDVIILALLFFPTKYTKELYLKIFFNTDKYVDFNSYTDNISFYEMNGLINGMYGTLLNNVFIEPENYNEEELNNLLSLATVETEKFGKPNIIVIFSESFWNIDVLEEVKFNKKITSNYNLLKQEGKLVDLITPTYGGMSENVCFELLTGGNMNYFSKGYVPIMSLYSRKNSSNIPSIVKVLNSNEYTSEIIFGKDYYNSKDAYLKMGFDKYSELINDEDTMFSDKDCTDDLIERLKTKLDLPGLYVLSTIEGHMPYSKDKYENYDIEITKSNLSNSMNETLRSYAQGLYNSDKELARIYEFIKDFDEPTILIFLGDHLPFLRTEDAQNVLGSLEYFNTNDNKINNYRIYNTQALILSNYDEKIKIPDYIGTDLLLNCIINQLDLENEEYYKWLYTTKDILAGSNRFVSFNKDGKIYTTRDLDGEMQEMYELKKLMQYKFFIDE